MRKYYANLLGVWTDITEFGTIDNKNACAFFEEGLIYDKGSKVAKCFEYDYLNVQYKGQNYRIHPAMIQIVTE